MVAGYYWFCWSIIHGFLGFLLPEPGYVFNKAILVQYDHMSFGGAPVEVGTEEEAEGLMLQNDKDSANGN